MALITTHRGDWYPVTTAGDRKIYKINNILLSARAEDGHAFRRGEPTEMRGLTVEEFATIEARWPGPISGETLGTVIDNIRASCVFRHLSAAEMERTAKQIMVQRAACRRDTLAATGQVFQVVVR